MRCEALTKGGRQCLNNAAIYGLCGVHFNMDSDKLVRIKREFPRGCEKCKERFDCRKVKMNYVVGCPKRDMSWR